jgi:hypothetical protein
VRHRCPRPSPPSPPPPRHPRRLTTTPTARSPPAPTTTTPRSCTRPRRVERAAVDDRRCVAATGMMPRCNTSRRRTGRVRRQTDNDSMAPRLWPRPAWVESCP